MDRLKFLLKNQCKGDSIPSAMAMTDKHFRFGTKNPTLMEKPFWKFMVCNPSMTGYDARSDNDWRRADLPIWCFARFGATQTLLPDGRLVQIAGEHEDSYDPDFQIYNDVVVINNPQHVECHYIYGRAMGNGGKILGTSNANDVTIYGYPRDIFPPTDFHTATYVRNENGSEYIYIIGGTAFGRYYAMQECSYVKEHDENVRVYRLCLSDFSIERVETSGNTPKGCTSRHTAKLTKVDGRQVIAIELSFEAARKCYYEELRGRSLESGNLTVGHHQFYRFDVETGVWTVFERPEESKNQN